MHRDVRAEREHLDRTVAGKTVCSLFRETVAGSADVDALKWKAGDAWHALTWRQYGEEVRAFAQGLMAIGLEPGEFVNILAANRPEYYIADIAILHAGAVPVSLYNSLPSEQIEYIVNHCEATYAIVENADFYDRLRAVKDGIPRVRRVIMIDGAEAFANDPWVVGYDAVLSAGRAAGAEARAEFDRRWQAVKPEGLATLIYTSGTTGPPKGVMVTHYNVVWTAESLHSLFPRDPGVRHISYLPLAHIAERMAGHYLQIRAASTCHFCPRPQDIAQYLAEVRPQFFFAVPRIWEKLHSGLTTAIANNPDAAQRAFAEAAIAAGLEKTRLEQAGRPIPAELAERLPQAEMVCALIRQRIGLDAVEIASSGAAPIAAEVLEWFHAIGVPVREVYGQSEDCGPTSWNRPGATRIGTVGPSLPGVEVRIADDGELLVRGGNVTTGYYKEPKLTAETFDADGWLHSGDVAVIDPAGFIKIVDRKKEILITAGGKNIAPSNIENLLKQKPLIGQACVVADRRPFVGALVVLDPESTLPWAQQRGLPTDLQTLAEHPEVHAEIRRYLDEVNLHLNNVESIKQFVVLPHEWTPDTGELTPTLKMKRRVVNQRYAEAIERMYAGGR
ncbi:AMP-dependent synthetase/ligase [Candidatus Binatia bacterium]|nr:AMP-dependent synthetase/ligase [Candidatus Binatia bacterium]